VLARNAPGSGPTRIPWSPDGRRLAYQDVAGIHVVPVTGRRAELLMRGTEISVAWAPRGGSIAFTGPAGVGYVTLTGHVRMLLRRTAAEPPESVSVVGWAPSPPLPYQTPEPSPPSSAG
jgi:dipeptidyl aminopeptidase/acylaminoacyl peptidase